MLVLWRICLLSVSRAKRGRLYVWPCHVESNYCVNEKKKKKRKSAKAARLIKEYLLQHWHSEPGRGANVSCKPRVRITRPVLIKTWLARDAIASCWWSSNSTGRWDKRIWTCEMCIAEGTCSAAGPSQWSLEWGQCKQCIMCSSQKKKKSRNKKETRTHRFLPFIGVHNKWLKLLQAGSPHVINICPFGNGMARE